MPELGAASTRPGAPDLLAIGPVTVDPGETGGALRTFEAFRAEVDGAGLTAQVVDTGPASVPRPLRRVSKAWVAARIVVVALRNLRRRTPVVWFMSGGMLRNLTPVVPLLARSAPVVVVTFGSWLGEVVPSLPPWRRRLAVRSLDRARLVTAEAERTVGQARAVGVGHAQATGVLRPAPRRAPRVQADEAARPLRLVYAGRVAADKGVDDLAALVTAGGGALVADVIGPLRPGDPVVAALLADPPAGLVLRGALPHEEVLDALREADATVLLSRYPTEGLPGAVVEALQLGTPAVVTDHLALPELVVDGESGFVVPVDDGGIDAAAVAERLLALDGPAWSAMRAAAAEAGRRHAPDRWLPMLLGPLGLSSGDVEVASSAAGARR